MPVGITVAVYALITTCAAMDIRSRHIPNFVTFSGIVVGVTLNGLYFGAPGVWASLGGLVLAIAFLLAPFALGGIGGGDVKMMGAVGALLGPRLGLLSLLLGMIVGGVVMAAYLLLRGLLRECLRSLRTMVSSAFLSRSFTPLRLSADEPGRITLPYSVPLGIGTIMVVALSPGALHL